MGLVREADRRPMLPKPRYQNTPTWQAIVSLVWSGEQQRSMRHLLRYWNARNETAQSVFLSSKFGSDAYATRHVQKTSRHVPNSHVPNYTVPPFASRFVVCIVFCIRLCWRQSLNQTINIDKRILSYVAYLAHKGPNSHMLLCHFANAWS